MMQLDFEFRSKEFPPTPCAICAHPHPCQRFGVLACHHYGRLVLKGHVTNPSTKADVIRSVDTPSSMESEQSARSTSREQSIVSERSGCSMESKPAMNMEPTVSSSLLNHHHLIYEHFQAEERKLFLQSNPHLENTPISSSNLSPLTPTEHQRIESATLPLVYSLLNDMSPSYRRLSHETKMEILGNFSPAFLYLHRCYATARLFSDENNRKQVIHCGYFADETIIPEVVLKNDAVLNYLQFCRPIVDKQVMAAKLMRDANLDEKEFIAMVNVLFYNTLRDMNITSVEADATMDQINDLLFRHIQQLHGSSQVGIRLGKVHHIIHYSTVRASELAESNLMLRYFFPRFCTGVWENSAFFK
uniref:NR LBD domain-containing protein n=3 Tax=Bursaphelenchus xylophilus TaxID=6326 RepID=A0A1I7S1M1_BURXY